MQYSSAFVHLCRQRLAYAAPSQHVPPALQALWRQTASWLSCPMRQHLHAHSMHEHLPRFRCQSAVAFHSQPIESLSRQQRRVIIKHAPYVCTCLCKLNNSDRLPVHVDNMPVSAAAAVTAPLAPLLMPPLLSPGGRIRLPCPPCRVGSSSEWPRLSTPYASLRCERRFVAQLTRRRTALLSNSKTSGPSAMSSPLLLDVSSPPLSVLAPVLMLSCAQKRSRMMYWASHCIASLALSGPSACVLCHFLDLAVGNDRLMLRLPGRSHVAALAASVVK